MRDKPKFISDENIPIKVIELLIEMGFDVKRAPLGFSDKQISKVAKLESRVILTFDKHFLNKDKFKRTFWNSIYINNSSDNRYNIFLYY